MSSRKVKEADDCPGRDVGFALFLKVHKLYVLRTVEVFVDKVLGTTDLILLRNFD